MMHAPAASAPQGEGANVAAMRPQVAPDVALTELRQEVMALRREVAELRVQSARLPVHPPPADPSDPRTDPTARQQARQAERERVAATESAFRQEPEDARWSRSTAALVQAALAQTGIEVRSQVRNVECRSQTCRVEIGAGAVDSLRQELPALTMRLAQTFPRASAGRIDQGDGRQATVLYLSR